MLFFLVPEAPTAVKALVVGAEAILVSWLPPAQPNGLISQYTVYLKEQGSDQEAKSHKVPPYQMSYEASGLEQKPFVFWVTANTNIGEGQQSNVIVAIPSDKVPAKIASFDDTFTATFKEDFKLPCLAVGAPTPDITWKVKGAEFVPNDRVRQLPEGSLFIKDVIRQDAGEYTCMAENSIAKDSITHKLIVLGICFFFCWGENNINIIIVFLNVSCSTTTISAVIVDGNHNRFVDVKIETARY